MNRLLLTLSAIFLCISFCNAQTRAKVTGTITDCETEYPLEGVAITAGEADTIYTDSQGNFTLNITNGIYTVLMEKEDYLPLIMFEANLAGLMTLDTCLSMNNPSMGISPDDIYIWIKPEGYGAYEHVNLTNYGSSVVSWNSVVEYGNYSDGKDYDWLSSLDQMNGTIMPGEYMELEFEIDPSNINTSGTYDATVYFYYGGGNFVEELYISFYYGWLSVEDIKNVTQLTILPNPSESFINIDFNNNSYKYIILDINGKIVHKGTEEQNSNTINIQSIPSGTYILKLEDENHQISVGKFVKQ